MGVDGTGNIQVDVGVIGPADRGAVSERRKGHRRELPVPVVAPVRDQIPDGAVIQAVAGGEPQVFEGVVRTSQQRVPAGTSRTYIEGNARRGELGAASGERMVCFVSPLHGNDVFRQLRNQFRVLQDNVAPELHGTIMLPHEGIDFFQKIQVYPAFPQARHVLPAASLAEAEGFVAAHVELAAGEVGQQAVIHAAQQIDARRVGGAQIGGTGRLGESLIPVMFKPPVHVTE